MLSSSAPSRGVAISRALAVTFFALATTTSLSAQSLSQVVGGPVPYVDNDTNTSEWGQNVALDGNRALVAYGCSAFFAPSTTCNFVDGPAEIWSRVQGTAWQRDAVLPFPDDMVDNAEFGKAIVLSGDWAIVGAPRDASGTVATSGRVFVYRRSIDGTWSLAQTINAAVPVVNGNFGRSLAFDGKRLLIGEPRGLVDGVTTGLAWLYTLNESNQFGNAVALVTPGSLAGDSFGAQVALVGDLAMVSAPNRELIPGSLTQIDVGAVATFEISNEPTYLSILLSDAPAPGSDQFGLVMRATRGRAGDILAVGAPFESNGPTGTAGAVHCYRFTRGAWQQIGVARGTSATERIDKIALSEDVLAIGGPRWGGTNGAGRTYLYHIGDNQLTLAAQIQGPDTNNLDDRTGSAVAVSGDSTAGCWLFRTAGTGSQSDDWAQYRSINFQSLAADGDGDGALNGVDVTLQQENDCDGNLVPDAVELAIADCDAEGSIDACQTKAISVSSLPTAPTETGWGAQSSSIGSTVIILSRVAVPEDSSGRLLSYGTKTLSFGTPGTTDLVLGVYRDPNGDGLLDDLELIDVGPAGASGAGVEVRRVLPTPVDVRGDVGADPSNESSLFVMVAFTRVEAIGAVLFMQAHPTPFVAGLNLFAGLPNPDYTRLPADAFAAFGSPTSAVGNPYVTVQFASLDDIDADGVVDTCVCTGDFDQNGVVDAADLGTLIGSWGATEGDLNGDETTDGVDLALLLAAWGAC